MSTTDDPDIDQLTFQQFCEDSDYLNSIWPQVRKEYPDRFVAVYKGEIVAEHETLDGVLAEMDGKGVPKNHAVLRYVSNKPRRRILYAAEEAA